MSERPMTEINIHPRDGLGGITAIERATPDGGATLRLPCTVHTDVSAGPDGGMHLSASMAGIATLHLDAEDVRELLAALAPVPVEAPRWTMGGRRSA